MKAARRALRDDPSVAAALNEWWEATDLDKSGGIDKDEYIELGKALYRVIIGDGNEAEAYKSAVNDWTDDCKGCEVMDGSRFKQAIFECACAIRLPTRASACPPPPVMLGAARTCSSQPQKGGQIPDF